MWMYPPKSHTRRERCMLTICNKNYNYNYNYYNNHPSVTQLNAVEEHHTAKKTTPSNNQALVTATTPITPTLISTSPLQPPKSPSDVTDLTETLSYLSNTSSFHLTALTNLTSTLPNNATASFSSLLQDFEREQSRQIRLATVKAVEVEKALTRAVGDLAYADTPLSDLQLIPTEFRDVASDKDAVRRSTNYTAVSRTERSGQIIKNWKAAPLYATASLLARWSTKCLTVPLRPAAYLTRIFQGGITLQPSSLSGERGAGKAEGYTGRGKDGADREAMRMQRRWKRSATTGALRRSVEIWGYALNFVLKERSLSRRRRRISPSEYSRRRSLLARECTQVLLRLGPTFIKVGQLLSTRIDIVPPEYIAELKLLQDDVPPFPGSLARSIVEEELGAPVEELFDEFNDESLAAASLGQVHVARRGSQMLAVKVQRRYLRELFEVDLRNLRKLATFLDAVDPKAEGSLLDANCERDWTSIYDESARLLYEEIDYVKERKNCDRFRENFSDKRFEHIRAPLTYPDLSSSKVLTMEYVPGVKVTDVSGIVGLGLDPADVGRKSAEAYLEQLCRHGFFHCDPHPGNVAVEADDAGQARLIFYDFGMMDTFGEGTRRGFVDFLFAFYENEVRQACNALADLGILRDSPDVDRIAVERVGKDFMDRFQETLEVKSRGGEGSFENEMDEDERRAFNKARRAKLGEEFLTMNKDVPFVFPPTWTFVFRAFMSLDGIGKTLDPQYDMTRIAKPYLKELIDLKDGSALKTLTLKFAKRLGLRPVDINMAVTQPRRTAFTEDVVRRLEQGEFKLRVRALEAERKLERQEIVMSNIFSAVVA
eukprot:CAMPEP_0197549190 /NCGR_PEP_ID=MMETSP1320-20131121/3153_1 /TAXON_ID=91990 /ORGANISM="Bolidomonas sp., Strain RCC2347" /LENGTH=826 /DNA_ID=CAMNT_0043109375 /DNA_START=152 /DNA_END=2628 /DNA_ORIENTATION=+